MKLNFGHILLSGHLILSIILGKSEKSVEAANKTLSNKMPDSPIMCRNKQLLLLNESMFYWDSCVQCYVYMPEDFFYPNEKMRYLPRYPGSLFSNNGVNITRFMYGDGEDRDNITATIVSVKGIQLWNQCCEAAKKCCQKMSVDPILQTGEKYCERQWDGWQCISDTPAGETKQISCPSYIYFYSEPLTTQCEHYASKPCYSDGTWANKTDYVSCGLTDSLRRRMYVNIGAFAFSLVFLIPAVIIFSAYKQLKVPRVVMHTNLFVALIVNGIVVIIYKSVISLKALKEGSDISNSGACKFALALTKYTRMATYMWMFCEGFYLHKLIVAAFAEEKRLVVYYIIGWVFPVIPVSIYAAMRKTFADTQCWMVPDGGFEWIINVPMLLSLALNLIFLCNIIRVLITKLQATHSNEPSQYRKAVRATVVLVPLFGLHFLLTIYLPNHGACVAVEFYYYFSYLIDGLQGFIVSLIFCYLNGEVLHLLKRSYQRHRLMNDPTGHYSRASASTQMMSVTELPSTCGKNSFPMR